MATKQERFLVTETCNWDCHFCGQHVREPQFKSLEALQTAFQESVPEPTGELILTGGEPTLHPQIVEFVTWLKREERCERLVIESNGSTASEAFAAALAEAGLDGIRLLWLGHRSSLAAKLANTRLTGEHAHWLRLAPAHELTIDLVIPLARGIVDHLPLIIDALSIKAPHVDRVLFQHLDQSRTPRQGRSLLPAPWEVGAALGDVWTKAGDYPFLLGWAEYFRLPACVDDRDWMTRTWVESRETAFERVGVELVRHAGCDSCAMERYCSGVDPADVEAFGVDGYRPRRTSIKLNWQEKEDAFPLIRKESRLVPFTDPEGGVVRATLRINGRCNHTCPFCFIDRAAPDLPSDEVMEDLQTLADMGGTFVAFTGGEPTLVKHLPDYVRRAAELGIGARELQTNAMAFDDPDYTQTLAEAGITTVLVSLHGSGPEISDRVTGFEGGWERTVAGIDNLCRSGVEVRINFVINSINVHHTAEFVRWAHERFIDVPHPIAHLTISTAQMTVYGEEWNIPPFDAVAGPLREALSYCYENDIPVGGILGECGIPPCALGPDMIPEEYRRNVVESPFHHEIFSYPEPCEGCAARSWCPGVRNTYLELHGTRALSTL